MKVIQALTADIINLTAEIQNAQEVFKTTHKNYMEITSTAQSVATVKQEIKLLDQEKEHILSKISKLKTKTDALPQGALLLNAAKLLLQD